MGLSYMNFFAVAIAVGFAFSEKLVTVVEKIKLRDIVINSGSNFSVVTSFGYGIDPGLTG